MPKIYTKRVETKQKWYPVPALPAEVVAHQEALNRTVNAMIEIPVFIPLPDAEEDDDSQD